MPPQWPDSRAEDCEFGEELADASFDLIADRPDAVDVAAGGVVRDPVLVAAARVDRAGVAATCRFGPARPHGATNVEFLHGAIEAIPLPNASIDVIISNCVINLSADKPAVFAEAFRVLPREVG